MALLTPLAPEFAGRTDQEGGVTAFASAPAGAVDHPAGSHALLTLGPGRTTPFPLASAPEDPHVLVGTRLSSGSRFERALAGLRPGDRGAFRAELDRLPTDLPRAAFHVSGSPAFVRDTTTALAAAGIPRRQVREEAFRGH